MNVWFYCYYLVVARKGVTGSFAAEMVAHVQLMEAKYFLIETDTKSGRKIEMQLIRA